MTNLPFGSRWIRMATSSRIALQVLSTRHGRLGSMNLQSPTSLISLTTTGGGGGCTFTVELQVVLKPRESVTVAVAVIALPCAAPLVSSVALAPVPLRRPAVVDHA